MTVTQKKDLISSIIEKMTKSQEREKTVKKELSNDNYSLLRVNQMVTDGENFPSDSGYKNFGDWIEKLTKQIETSNNSLIKLANERIEIEALQYYVDNIA